MSHPSWPPPGEPPVQPTTPALYESPTGFGLVAPEARRARRRGALVVLVISLLVGVVSAVAVVVPLVRAAQQDADDALDSLEVLGDLEPPGGGADGAVDGPDRVPLPLEDAPPLAEPVDGRYGLDGFVRFEAVPRLVGEPVDGWVADPDDPAVWRSGGCTLIRQDDEVITFDVPDPATTDRTWTLEGLGYRAGFMADDVQAIAPQGEPLALTIPTSDGALLEAVGQVYDVTALDGRQAEMAVAARALTWNDVTYYLTLTCPAGTVADPAAALQRALDAHLLVLP